MEIKFFCPRWGSEHVAWDRFCKNVKEAGYDGVEYGIPYDIDAGEIEEAWNSMERNGLLIIAQHYDTSDAVFARHAERYIAWLERMKDYPCLKINSQTGRDFFTFEQNSSLISSATTFSENHKIEVLHETHRGKFSFAAHITRQFMAMIPSLKLTLDISHWVNVSESFLEDQQEAVVAAISRAEHIHTRVGFPEGPQINDPRAPEWKDILNTHLGWWDQVVKRKMKAAHEMLTMTPEFGPYPYMPRIPYTCEPVCSQWEVNQFMMDMLRQRYTSDEFLVA